MPTHSSDSRGLIYLADKGTTRSSGGVGGGVKLDKFKVEIKCKFLTVKVINPGATYKDKWWICHYLRSVNHTELSFLKINSSSTRC